MSRWESVYTDQNPIGKEKRPKILTNTAQTKSRPEGSRV